MQSVPYALCKCFLYSLSIIHKENPFAWKIELGSVFGHRLHEIITVSG